MSLSTPTTSTMESDFARCIITSMPAEIKEHIYKYVLLPPTPDKDFVQVTSTGYIRPALLQTNKEIRREALKLWYYNTKFHTNILNFDSTPLLRWGTSFKSIGLARGKVTMYSTPSWEPSWNNLLVWLELYHAGKIHGRCPRPDHLLEQAELNHIDLCWHLLGNMFDVAKALREMRWKEVEAIMVNFRPSLIAADALWKFDALEL